MLLLPRGSEVGTWPHGAPRRKSVAQAGPRGHAGGDQLGCLFIAPTSWEGRRRHCQRVEEREENQIRLSYRRVGQLWYSGKENAMRNLGRHCTVGEDITKSHTWG